jgi:hypothetical protein
MTGRPGIHTAQRLLDAPLMRAPWRGPAMMLRMAEALLEADAFVERSSAMGCLCCCGYLSADIEQLVDEAREMAAAIAATTRPVGKR